MRARSRRRVLRTTPPPPHPTTPLFGCHGLKGGYDNDNAILCKPPDFTASMASARPPCGRATALPRLSVRTATTTRNGLHKKKHYRSYPPSPVADGKPSVHGVKKPRPFLPRAKTHPPETAHSAGGRACCGARISHASRTRNHKPTVPPSVANPAPLARPPASQSHAPPAPFATPTQPPVAGAETIPPYPVAIPPRAGSSAHHHDLLSVPTPQRHRVPSFSDHPRKLTVVTVRVV